MFSLLYTAQYEACRATLGNSQDVDDMLGKMEDKIARPNNHFDLVRFPDIQFFTKQIKDLAVTLYFRVDRHRGIVEMLWLYSQPRQMSLTA